MLTINMKTLTFLTKILSFNPIVYNLGFGSEPMFMTMTADDMEKGVKWGKENPPGGPGSCLMQFKGSLYNASCDQNAHYTCQEKPIPDHLTTP